MTVEKIQLQMEFKECPLCNSESEFIGSSNCNKHSNWHEQLPSQLEWMRCQKCQHIHTRHYWSESGLLEVFRKSHSNQLAGLTDNPDLKRATWSKVIEKVIDITKGAYCQSLNCGEPLTWLDVGCGDGALTMTAADFGFNAIGLDARSESVKRIRQMGFNAEQGDFLKIKFEGHLDVLTMMDVLEHMPYPGNALKKAASILKIGGIIVISLPDLNSSSWRILDKLKINPYWMEIEHYHNFSRQRLISLLHECGFEIISFSIPYRYKAQMEIYAIRS